MTQQPVYLDSVHVYAQLNGVWTDMTSYLIRDIDAEWGIPGNGPLDLLAGTGTMDIVLDNSGLNLIPDLGGALSGWKRGVGFKLVLTFEGEDYVRFKGSVSKITPENGLYGHLRVHVHVVDWMEYAANHPIVNPPIQTNQHGDDVIRAVLALMPIQPAATALDVGVSNFVTIFDTVTTQTKAYAEFGKVVFSESPGFIYLQKDRTNGETLVFENNQHRNGLQSLSALELGKTDSGFLQKEDGGYLLKEDGKKIILNQTSTFIADNNMLSVETQYGERVINRFTVHAYPRRLDSSPTVLFKLDVPVPIGSGQTIQFKGTYADPAGGAQINGVNMITPATPTDYKVWTNSDGTGTDISSSLVVTPGYGGGGFIHTLYNTSGFQGWITQFTARGTGIYQYNPIEHVETDPDSDATYGTQADSMDQLYQTSLLQGTVYAATTIEEERNARMILDKVNFLANRTSTLMMAFLYGDVGLLFRCKNDNKGIDDLYYVQGVKFKIKPGGAIMFIWTVKKIVMLALGLSQIAVEFGGISTSDAVNFGHLPQTTNLTQRSFSVWVYPNSITGNQDIISLFGEESGMLFRIYGAGSTAGHPTLQVRSKMFSNLDLWYANSVLTTGQWNHIVLTYDVTNYPSDPILYVNGSLVAWSSSSLSGFVPMQDESGIATIIGNENTANVPYYQRAFEGKIKDARIYNRILSASEAATLYNSGTPDPTLVTNGMVFQAFFVRTGDLSKFINQTLTSELKMLDNVLRAVGTSNGAPIGRTP